MNYLLLLQMDRNKISRKLIIENFFEKNNKNIKLEEIISKVIKENQRKYGHSKTVPDDKIKFLVKNFKIRWNKCKNKSYFYKKFSSWLDIEEKLVDKNGKFK